MDKNEIRELLRFFDKSDITKLKIKEGDFSIELQKGSDNNVSYSAPVVMAAATPQASVPTLASTAPAVSNPPVAVPATTKEGTVIKSPMVGTFYKSPAPGAPAFASVGAVIRKGKPIGIIEAMKIMNEIEAEFDCKITEILVEDGQPVEFDMPLFLVEKV